MRPVNMKPTSTPAPRPGRDGRLPSLLTVNVANMTDAVVRDALDIADLSEWTTAASHVNLSLNKKGRWEAVESLKTDIEMGVYNDADYTVCVIERFWLNRQSNCEEITANEGSYITNKRYSVNLFNADSLLSRRNKGKVKPKRVDRKKGGDSPDPSTESPPTPEMRVEVVRPYNRWVPGTPVASRRRREREQRKNDRVHALKSQAQVIDHNDWDGQEDWATEPVSAPQQTSKPKPSSKPKKDLPTPVKTTLQTLTWDFDLGTESDLEDEIEEEEEEEDNDIMCNKIITLGDYILKTDNTEVHVSRKHGVRRQPASNKGNVVYVDKTEMERFAPHVTSETDDTGDAEDENNSKINQENDLIVSFNKEDVSPDSLAGTFGERYTECDCCPRRFVLDMTGAIRNVPHWLLSPQTHIRVKRHRYRNGRGRGWFTHKTRRHFTYFQKTAKEVTSAGFLVFEEEHDGKFRLKLETDADVDVTSWASTIEASTGPSPQSVADSVCDVLSKKENSTKQKPFDNPKHVMTFSTLKHMLRWPEADSFHPSPFPLITSKRVLLSQVQGTPETAECCSICYDVIDMTSGDSQGLALTSCRHWFCKVCWKSHVATNIENGAVAITCPEYGCKTRVDEGTMASLLTLRQLQMYKSRLDDMEIQTSGSKLWCPKPGCGRIVSVHQGTSGTGCVQCDCDATFCVQCRGHPHWPADCSHLKGYESDLKRFGDDSVMSWTSDASRVVKGKKCPECQSFIEKNMGCPNMVCRCGHSFCWQCFKPWNSHPYNPQCYSKPDNQDSQHLQDVYMEDLTERPQSRSPAYVLALTSRHKQQHRQRASLGRHVTRMKRELKGLVSRQKLLEAGAFKMSHQRKEVWLRQVKQMRHVLEETEAQEKKHLLDWAYSLIYEIHHVIEYSAVLIDHHKNDPRLRCAPSLVRTLMFLVGRMEVVFEDGVKQKMTMVPVKLARYTNLAMKTLADLRGLKPYLPTISRNEPEMTA